MYPIDYNTLKIEQHDREVRAQQRMLTASQRRRRRGILARLPLPRLRGRSVGTPRPAVARVDG